VIIYPKIPRDNQKHVKVSLEEGKKIRWLFNVKHRRAVSIAFQFGISRTHVYKILHPTRAKMYSKTQSEKEAIRYQKDPEFRAKLNKKFNDWRVKRLKTDSRFWNYNNELSKQSSQRRYWNKKK